MRLERPAPAPSSTVALYLNALNTFADPEGTPRIYKAAKNVQNSERFVVLWCKTVLGGFKHQGMEMPPEDKYYSDPSKQVPPDYFNK